MNYSPWQRREHVRELQTYLRQIAQTETHYAWIGIDGTYGPETAHAVRLFQKYEGLPITGEVDTNTWNALVTRAADAECYGGPPRPIFPFSPASLILEKGCTGCAVSILQAMLNELGKTDGTVLPLSVSGTFDAATEAAVRRLQACCNCTVTGTVDAAFWNVLALHFNAAVT